MAEPSITVDQYEAAAALPLDDELFNRGTNTLVRVVDQVVLPDGGLQASMDVLAGNLNLAYSVDVIYGPGGEPVSLSLKDQQDSFTQNHRDMVGGAIEDWQDFRGDTPFDRGDYSRDNPTATMDVRMVEEGIPPFDQGGILPKDDIFRRSFSEDTGRLDVRSCSLIPAAGGGEPQGALCISNIFNPASGIISQQLSLHALVDNTLISSTGPEVGRDWFVDNSNNDTQLYNEDVAAAVDKGGVSFGLRQ